MKKEKIRIPRKTKKLYKTFLKENIFFVLKYKNYVYKEVDGRLDFVLRISNKLIFKTIRKFAKLPNIRLRHVYKKIYEPR
jgi:hypothetical protein